MLFYQIRGNAPPPTTTTTSAVEIYACGNHYALKEINSTNVKIMHRYVYDGHSHWESWDYMLSISVYKITS